MNKRKKYGLLLLGLVQLLPALMLLLRNWNGTRRNDWYMVPSDKYYLVLKLLLQNGFSIPVARMVAAQFAHETANFSSELFEKANNPSGMKYFKDGRDTTLTGNYKGYASYNSLAEGVADYALWWQAAKMPFLRFSGVGRFVEALKDRGYFTDSLDNYLRGVTHFYNLYKISE